MKGILIDIAVLNRFRVYHMANLTWGSLHIVLDDGNTDDDCVKFCLAYAMEHGDSEGAALACELAKFTEEQRDVLFDILS